MFYHWFSINVLTLTKRQYVFIQTLLLFELNTSIWNPFGRRKNFFENIDKWKTKFTKRDRCPNGFGISIMVWRMENGGEVSWNNKPYIIMIRCLSENIPTYYAKWCTYIFYKQTKQVAICNHIVTCEYRAMAICDVMILFFSIFWWFGLVEKFEENLIKFPDVKKSYNIFPFNMCEIGPRYLKKIIIRE